MSNGFKDVNQFKLSKKELEIIDLYTGGESL
jgi:hypothetical protein